MTAIEQLPKVQENVTLCILIHGYGSNEQDLFSFKDDLPPHFYIKSLRGLHTTPFGGFSWYDISMMGNTKHSDYDEAQKSRDIIHQFVLDTLSEVDYQIDEVCLMGFSQGAILSYSLALNYPEVYHKVVCLSGYPEPKIIGDVVPSASHSKQTFFVSHGIEDVIIPVEWARKAEGILQSFQIPYEYHEYPAGHTLNPQNYHDLMAFIAR